MRPAKSRVTSHRPISFADSLLSNLVPRVPSLQYVKHHREVELEMKREDPGDKIGNKVGNLRLKHTHGMVRGNKR